MITKQKIKTIFGTNLKRFRLQKKLSQAKLAEKIDVYINTISEMERGIHFTNDEYLARLSNCLEIETYELFLPENITPPITYEQFLASIEKKIIEGMEKFMVNYMENSKKSKKDR